MELNRQVSTYAHFSIVLGIQLLIISLLTIYPTVMLPPNPKITYLLFSLAK